jgi:hypothetical protein
MPRGQLQKLFKDYALVYDEEDLKRVQQELKDEDLKIIKRICELSDLSIEDIERKDRTK